MFKPRTSLPAVGVFGTLLIGGAFVLGACSSSSTPASNTGSSSTSSSSNTATSTSSNTGTSTTAGSTGGATSTSAPATGGTGISGIVNKLQAGQNATFDATYKSTSGGSAQSVEIADQGSSYAIDTVSSSGTKSNIFSNGTKLYECTQNSGSSTWMCTDMTSLGIGTLQAATQVYTGKYWGQILKAYVPEAAALGATFSTETIAGQSAQCISYKPSSSSGGKVCVTDSGVLALVQSTSSSFELQSYSGSPAASLFQLPAGATAGTIP